MCTPNSDRILDSLWLAQTSLILFFGNKANPSWEHTHHCFAHHSAGETHISGSIHRFSRFDARLPLLLVRDHVCSI